MRKGFTTLLTVAIALIGSQAMAMAPTISDIPSPIVGGSTGASQTTKFVYPDAFNLDTLVSDDQTTPTSLLKWTYEQVGSTYLINGIKSINSATKDPITVTDAETINRAPARGTGWTGSTVEGGVTPLSRITIRNHHCNPLGGSGITAGLATGFIDTVPITFWCSDGNAVSSATVLFYTDNFTGGFNRLSQKPVNWTNVGKETFFNKTWAVSEGFYGACTTHTWPATGTGVCFEVAKTGNNWGSIASPLGFLSLSPNTLYRIRAKMISSQLTAGHTPFWDLVVENNYDAVLKKGLNLYSMDQIFLDNVGGANAITSQNPGGTELTMYFAPSAVSTPQFNHATTGLFAPANTANKDARVRFRVLDVDSNAALLNDQKYGSICLQSIQIDALPIAKVVAGTALVNITAFRRNTDTVADPLNPGKTIPNPLNNVEVSGINGPSIVFTSGALTVTPAGSGTGVELLTITPAKDPSSAGTFADNWPIPWTSNKILELDATIVAPVAYDALHPWDALWLAIESPTNEVNCESVITSVKGIASPKTTAAVYKLFFNTQNETVIGSAQYHFFRWRVRFGNNTTLNFPAASDTTNTGAARLTALKVSTVTVPDN